MKFVELDLANGNIVLVNPLSIAYVEPCAEECCIVYFIGNNPTSLEIQMPYSDIKKKIGTSTREL